MNTEILKKKLEEKITPLDNLDITQVNVIENNLLYITSVLEKLDYIVSKTYGPFSGYVASQKKSDMNNASIFEYTKDGMTTLSNLNFMVPTDCPLTIISSSTSVKFFAQNSPFPNTSILLKSFLSLLSTLQVPIKSTDLIGIK